MDRSWARAYAERWGLPLAAVAELNKALEILRLREGEASAPIELPSDPTSAPSSLPGEELWSAPSEFGGTVFVRKTFAPIVELAPITVSPPMTVVPA